MKPFLQKTVVLIGFCFFLHSISRAQATSPSMTVDGDPVSASPTQEQEPIYQGAEYWRFPYTIENGNAYYRSDTITTGDVVYYNRLYKNVPLLYDQIADELVTLDISGHIMIRLFSPKIDSFHIHGSTFIYYTNTTDAEKQGFWEVLVNSDTKLIKREFRVIEERVKESRIARFIKPHLYYRIFIKGVYHDVEDKRNLDEIFANRNEQVQAFLKTNRRRFRRAGFEAMLTATTIYYNEITAAR